MTTVEIREELLDRLGRMPPNQQLRLLGFARSLGGPFQKIVKSQKAKSRWAQVAEFFESDEAGHLNGKSDQVKMYVADFREGFRL